MFLHLFLFRLRHEKLKPEKIDRGGPSEYQMLQCYDLGEFIFALKIVSVMLIPLVKTVIVI